MRTCAERIALVHEAFERCRETGSRAPTWDDLDGLMLAARAACCSSLHRAMQDCGEEHDVLGCPDQLIGRFEDGRYGILVHDGGSAMSVINFCPYCGKALAGAA